MSNEKSLAVWTNPTTITEAMGLAKLIADSSMVPAQYKGKPGDVIVAMQMGAEVGLSAMQSIQNIAVINGRPSLWGDAMLALCQSHPDFEDIQETVTDHGATCVIKRRGRSPVSRAFTVADAKSAGLIGKQGPWSSYPKRMLQMRARAFALRDAFADALRGLDSAEESTDIPVKTECAVIVDQEPAQLVEHKSTMTLGDMLDAIAKCTDEASLAGIGAACHELPPDEKDKARKAYSRKKKELSAKAIQDGAQRIGFGTQEDARKANEPPPAQEPENIDPVTGEIREPGMDG